MEKSTRPVRNRRHSRRAWAPGDIRRPVKRLFTPEIKKLLKDWLVRRRENPYPSRDEKKTLAIDTGLTYTQICNWFANWRRKLKNAGNEPQKKTWGHLIKSYNYNAKGNVEQFSICSNDSIWGDNESQLSQSPMLLEKFDVKNDINNNVNNTELYHRQYSGCANSETLIVNSEYHNYNEMIKENSKLKNVSGTTMTDHCYTPKKLPNPIQPQCFQISSTTDEKKYYYPVNTLDMNKDPVKVHNFFTNPKYKSQIMEKYLRGLGESVKNTVCEPELSKWLESAANFTPNKNNYIDWNGPSVSPVLKTKSEKKMNKLIGLTVLDANLHQKEELDAAEALTRLAGNYRNRQLGYIQ